jgi:predicted XRE-type DNA-binding protein
MMTEKSKIYRSSGNVYADLGFVDPELMLAKAKLAVQIRALIKTRGLTQVEAAELLGVAQPDISMITRGLLDNFSIERLMNLLLRFNQEIEITVRPAEHGARYIVTDPVATAAD